jgi:hypothetical protein
MEPQLDYYKRLFIKTIKVLADNNVDADGCVYLPFRINKLDKLLLKSYGYFAIDSIYDPNKTQIYLDTKLGKEMMEFEEFNCIMKLHKLYTEKGLNSIEIWRVSGEGKLCETVVKMLEEKKLYVKQQKLTIKRDHINISRWIVTVYWDDSIQQMDKIKDPNNRKRKHNDNLKSGPVSKKKKIVESVKKPIEVK